MFPGPENKWCLQHEAPVKLTEIFAEILWIHTPLGMEMLAVGKKHRL